MSTSWHATSRRQGVPSRKSGTRWKGGKPRASTEPSSPVGARAVAASVQDHVSAGSIVASPPHAGSDIRLVAQLPVRIRGEDEERTVSMVDQDVDWVIERVDGVEFRGGLPA